MNCHLYDRYPLFVAAVRLDHVKQNAEHGHGFLHASEVANLGYLIAVDERTSELAWVAGLMHNTDRIFGVDKVEALSIFLTKYCTLYDLDLTRSEKNLVIEAVREHSKKNDPCDNAVTVALKDADRLANAGAGVLIRAGQFRPNDPVIDLRYIFAQDPTATFKEPKTQLRNLEHILEWESWLRLPKAKQMGARRFARIRTFISWLVEDLREAKLLDDAGAIKSAVEVRVPDITYMYFDPTN